MLTAVRAPDPDSVDRFAALHQDALSVKETSPDDVSESSAADRPWYHPLPNEDMFERLKARHCQGCTD